MSRKVRKIAVVLLATSFLAAPSGAALTAFADETSPPQGPVFEASTAKPTKGAQVSRGTSVALANVRVPRHVAPVSSAPELSDYLAAAYEYVTLQDASWQARTESEYWAQQSSIADDKLRSLQRGLTLLREEAEDAAAKAQESRANLARWVMRTPSATGYKPSTLDVFMAGSDYAEGLVHERAAEQVAADALSMQLAISERDQAAAEDSQRRLDIAEVAVNDQAEKSKELREAASRKEKQSKDAMVEAQQAWNNAMLAATQQESSLGVRILETALGQRWNDTLSTMRDLDINIPRVKDLHNTLAYPENLQPPNFPHALDRTGVAVYEDILVPSKESVKRVSWALGQLGEPYVAPGDPHEGIEGLDGWSCNAFVSKSLGLKKVGDLSKIYSNAGRQNKHIASTAPGDIVFFANPSSGVHQAGVYISGGFVVTASASAGRVAIERVGPDAILSLRPGLDGTHNVSAPKPSAAQEGAPSWVCGAVEGSDSDESGSAFGWHHPLTTDEYERGVRFDDEDERFADGSSPGIELVVSSEQTVHAPYDGIVIYAQKDDQWGNNIIIEHESGLQAHYAFLSALSTTEGAEVKGGQVVATVEPSQSVDEWWDNLTKKERKDEKKRRKGADYLTNTIKHDYNFLLMVKAGGMRVNPEALVFPEIDGLYQNGRLPLSALCRISTGGYLRCDAARSFEMLAAAYKDHFGKNIVVTDTYRSLEGQIKCRATKGDMCAVPGTSNHGWGLAVDFGGGINNFGTPQHMWMVMNAGKFGWIHPQWAQKNGSLPEPWHWEFGKL